MNFKTFLPLQRLLSHLCCLQLYKRNKSVCRQNVTLSIYFKVIFPQPSVFISSNNHTTIQLKP